MQIVDTFLATYIQSAFTVYSQTQEHTLHPIDVLPQKHVP